MCLCPFSSRGQTRNIIATRRITWYKVLCNCQFSQLKCVTVVQLTKTQVVQIWSDISEKTVNTALRFLLSSWGSYLTVHPADTYGLKYGHEQQTHPAGSVRVEQLEDVHPSLIGQDRCQFSVAATTWASDSGGYMKYEIHQEWLIMHGKDWQKAQSKDSHATTWRRCGN